jgi:stringent starvation protein B
MSDNEIASTKPYLLRAIFEWAEDSGFTAQVLVNASIAGVTVPANHVVDGQIILNISSSAVKLHSMDNESLSFSARFSGVEQSIYLPIESILAIFARENSQGIYFEDADGDGGGPGKKLSAVKAGKTVDDKHNSNTTNINIKRKKSHLKIIK